MRAIALPFALTVAVVGLVCAGCGGEEEEAPIDRSGLVASSQMIALAGTQQGQLCDWAAGKLKSVDAARTEECENDGVKSYITAMGAEHCKTATPPSCTVGAAEECVLAGIEDLCKALEAPACRSYFPCAKGFIIGEGSAPASP